MPIWDDVRVAIENERVAAYRLGVAHGKAQWKILVREIVETVPATFGDADSVRRHLAALKAAGAYLREEANGKEGSG